MPEIHSNFHDFQQDLYNYRPQVVARGSFSQSNDPDADYRSKGQQCTACAVVYCFGHYTGREVDRDFMDECTGSGSFNHKDICTKIRLTTGFRMLSVDDIRKHGELCYLDTKKFKIGVLFEGGGSSDTLQNDTARANGFPPFACMNLMAGIRKAFEKSNYLILTVSCYTSALIKRGDEDFLWLDSHGNNMEGYLDGSGVSCAMKFSFLSHFCFLMYKRHPNWSNYNVCAIGMEEIETPQVSEPAKMISQEIGAELQVYTLYNAIYLFLSASYFQNCKSSYTH